MAILLLMTITLCAATILALKIKSLYPKPYPGIPYNPGSAARLTGDIPDLVPVAQSLNQFSESLFTVTTRKLRAPIAQFLFPGFLFRPPLVVLEEPREVADILIRRNREFDKAPMALDIFRPMFPRATIGQYTTPELKAQKRLWADVMSAEFLHKVAAPNVHGAIMELVELWRLRARSGAVEEEERRGTDVEEQLAEKELVHVLPDLQNATLDAMWVALVGEEPGLTRHEAEKLRCRLAGHENGSGHDNPPPRGLWLQEELTYIADTIARNSNSPSPKWAQKFETYTPRYRRFRGTVVGEISQIMRRAVARFQGLGIDKLDEQGDTPDTCMMDMVLRRQIREAKKAKRQMTDPTKDESMLDEMFVMLVGGHDSTANVAAWFIRFMSAFPSAQAQLRSVLKAAFPGCQQPSVHQILESHIPYLDATCEEGFRLAGVAKANLRQALVDTEILGCRIPKGAQIFMNYHVDRLPAPVDEDDRSATSRAAAEKLGNGLRGVAGEALERFEPRRWLVKDPASGRETFDANALPQLAFGGGVRGCTGRKLAMMEFRIIVTLLMLNFEFGQLPEQYRHAGATEKIFRHPDMPYANIMPL